MQVELPSNRQMNHKIMRVIVGVIALLLSPVVYFLSNSENELTSISISYWTDSRDIFVGSLVVVGFFLSAYNGAGRGRDWAYYVSKLACVFAICIAFFPTEGFSEKNIPAKWIQVMADSIGLEAAYIHTGAAILLFACLIAIMWSFSVRARSKGKHGRAYFYRDVSILMAVGIIALSLIYDTIFWVEVWGLTLFGIGWLAAGTYRTESGSDTSFR